MSKIVILDEKTANQIAAGEVIERPASVVKEMVENAIDAGATQITVEIRNGGVSYIRITDNGSGMEGDDVEIAFERHATSKIRRIEDLDGLSTMGFRGEALASIASVSHLEVTTKTEDAPIGTSLKMEGGRVISVSQVGCPKGTSFIVRNLFYNTPARYKFLKKDATEAGYVSDIIERLALAHPGISFKFIQNNQVQLHTPGNNDLLSVIYSIYGKDIAKSVLPVSYENEGFSVTGFVGKPEIARGTRNNQSIFLNGRYIKSRMISNALEEAFKTMVMQNKFPFCVLLLKASPESFDVNVHPQKLEVRFSNESTVYSCVYHGVKNALMGTSLIRDFDPHNTDTPKPTPKPVSDPAPQQASLFETAPAKSELKTPAFWEKPSRENASKTYTPEVKITEIPAPVLISNKQESVSPIIENQSQDEATPSSKFEVSHPWNAIHPSNILSTNSEEEESVSTSSDVQQEEIAAPDIPAGNDSKPRDASLQAIYEAEIVGQAFDTYILLQNGDTLYVIDQHAAHERIRYETLKQRIANQESFSQSVLEPFIIKLQAREYNFVMDKQEAFRALGFDLESFGTNTVILRSVPDFYDSSFSVNDFHEILDRWMQTNTTTSPISDEAIFMMSCKGALKANRALSKEEIRGLVADLCSMENPYTCVHGRPVIMSMDKKEFEKRFKRIV